ncbi:methionine--tRNA ligase [Candidatus Kaiserbacteria bacterium CG10_big_fil_rev_8_21_14_0_10_59_10]|uniref:Methionine--tRNA ligase n=1 Tax=Candidatus Kaiserbacteria bacterium CG10_big_fil_rev_8_21_14_0_10_59_10 TaxID=1974612 RepID=A0A2H0U8H1_9BACT|nr:MAG: methionine--tRNA ligase [Candidatus Kaiserbacteria bacterium CG10_big_fil_rev_8_21_14_0_10_59_10]
MHSKNVYITTTLPYVNAEPHVGFALELVQADMYARYRTLQGDDVFFNTGTDEHGLKIYRKALEEGKDPQAYVDEYAAKFRALKDTLGLYPGLHFIRTTDPRHTAAAQEIWRRCRGSGDIYKKKYKGLYCVGDEAFIKESELVDGKCPNHPSMEPIEIEEENYFFRLSAYGDRVREYLSRDSAVIPEWRRAEALAFVERGLEDFSISRVKEKMPWGVPVPDDDTQTMYVWFDALTNYISTLGWPFDSAQGKPGQNLFDTFWVDGETLQLAGKDQVRFQSIMWQAMLMSAGLPTTKRVVYHGFVTSGGKKMSKSLGNVIDPLAIVGAYSADALRYFLARHIHPFEDGDFTMERFHEAYTANLVNGIGNLTARIMALAAAHLSEGVQPEPADFPPEYGAALDSFEFNRAADYVWGRVQALDQKITETEPFKLVKADVEKGRALIAELAVELYAIGRMLNPLMPGTSAKIEEAVLSNKKPETLFPRKE